MHPCPRCYGKLDEVEIDLGPGQFGKIEILRCPDECGLVVAQNRMIPFLSNVARESLDCIDPFLEIQPAPHDPSKFADCPGCGTEMKTFRYMETKFAHLDRCNKCSVIWIDHDQLETCVRLAARNLGQHAKQRAERDELNRHLSAMVWITGKDAGGGSY